MKLVDLARVVRSKNAGPLHVTVDLMFTDEADFAKASVSPSLSAGSVAKLYGARPDSVKVIPFPAAYAIKVVMDRPIIAGGPGDTDVYGAQQHKPLLGIEI